MRQDEAAKLIVEAVWSALVAYYRRRLHAADLAMQRTGSQSFVFRRASPRAQIRLELTQLGYHDSQHISEGIHTWSLPGEGRGQLHAAIVNHNMTPEIDDPSFHLRCRFTYIIEFDSPLLPDKVMLSSDGRAVDADAMVRLDELGPPGDLPMRAVLEFETHAQEQVQIEALSFGDALRLLAGDVDSSSQADALIENAGKEIQAHELRLESWRCAADRLYLVYGLEIADEPSRTRDARRLIEKMHAHVDAFRAWCEHGSDFWRGGSLEQHAWTLLEGARTPSSMRLLAANILSHIEQSPEQRQRFARRLLDDFDMASIASMAHMLSVQDLESLEDDALLELGSTSDHQPLHHIIASRIDFIEKLYDQTCPAYERDVALRGLLMLGDRALITKHLPEVVKQTAHEHVPALCVTLIELAPDDLWSDERLAPALRARVSSLPALDRLRAHEGVLGASWTRAQRARLWELLASACLDAQPPRFEALEPKTMLEVLLHRAHSTSPEGLEPLWRGWLERRSFVEVLGLLREEDLDFISWLRTTRHVLYLSRSRTDILYDRSARGALLEMWGKWLRRGISIPSQDLWLLDEVVLKLCDYDPDVFVSAHDLSLLRAALEAYEHHTQEVMGLRAGALAALNTLQEDLPEPLASWCEKVVERWKQELGAQALAGGLTYVEGGDRAGGLTLEER